MNQEGREPDKITDPISDEGFEEELTFGQRIADIVTSFGGSWPFVFLYVLMLLAWMFYQTVLADNKSFDPYPYIFLNLVLSCLAAIQAPIILMSQNRQTQRDRLKADHDYEINRRAAKEIDEIQISLDKIREGQDMTITAQLDAIQSILNRIDKYLNQNDRDG